MVGTGFVWATSSAGSRAELPDHCCALDSLVTSCCSAVDPFAAQRSTCLRSREAAKAGRLEQGDRCRTSHRCSQATCGRKLLTAIDLDLSTSHVNKDAVNPPITASQSVLDFLAALERVNAEQRSTIADLQGSNEPLTAAKSRLVAHDAMLRQQQTLFSAQVEIFAQEVAVVRGQLRALASPQTQGNQGWTMVTQASYIHSATMNAIARQLRRLGPALVTPNAVTWQQAGELTRGVWAGETLCPLAD